ncbi:unnamed protein product [Urochloa decumbens]|uniref:Uncharacterized protein n=1 Tax=Urochloa decumbens TaxID=240449 RepID=A0ABC8WTJ0_9POAL
MPRKNSDSDEAGTSRCGDPVIGSKRAVATFVAEIAWSHGVSILHDLIPRLISLSAKGACEAELVCSILRSISNVGITHDALFKVGDRGETLLHGLGEFLPQVLALLCSLLDKHTRDSFSDTSNQYMEDANQHECTVKAALDTAQAYAEWTPVTDLARYGLIQRCGSLLHRNIFRIHALQFFKSIMQSKRPVGIAIAEYDPAVSSVFPILMNISEGSLKFVEPEMQCLKAPCSSLRYPAAHPKVMSNLFELLESVPATCEDISDGMSCHLVEEHNVLAESFTLVASFPRVQKDPGLLSCILIPLSKIWSQPEWEINLMDYFCDAWFRTSVHNIFVLVNEELKKCMPEKSNGTGPKVKSSWSTLLPLMLPILLKLLQYIHSLWTDEVAFNISEELEEAKFIMCSVDSSDLENEIRVWLQKIRKTGYMVIGNCSYLEGAFHNLLDNTLVCGALLKNIDSMEFRHVTWLIRYAIIPLLKNCPCGLWKKWLDVLLKPVFHYCEYTLYSSWCHLLYKNMVHVPDNFGDASVSKEKLDKLGSGLMFKLTREVSHLFAVIALPDLNGGLALERQSIIQKVARSEDLESILSSSLVGYLLYHDDINDSVLRLISYIFGYWTDGVARTIAVPFCHRLIQLATVTHSNELISYVNDDIIPNVIRSLEIKPCSDGNKEIISVKSESDILTNLCYDAYLCTADQGLVSEGTFPGSNAEFFRKWLLKQVEVVHCKNECVDELEEIVCIWEIEEEFISYLPTYTTLILGVDSFVNNLKDGYFLQYSPTEIMNEFLSKHAVDSSDVWVVSAMLSRKLSSEHWKRQSKQSYEFFHKLINFNKPYIKDGMQYFGYNENVQKLLEDNSEEWPSLAGYNRSSTLELFCSILELWEPQFHPMIREAHKNVLIEMASQLTFGDYIDLVQPFQPDSEDFLEHLQPYAQNYIDDKNKTFGYDKAKEQTKLHKQFDIHLASGALDPYIRQIRSSKGNFYQKTLDGGILGNQFVDLDYVLRAMSLERRAKLLEEEDRQCLYLKHMEIVVANEQEQLRNGLKSLIQELKDEQFFLVDVDDNIEWGKKRFSELVNKFEEDVFAGLHLPKYYVIRGIMDLQQMLCMEDRSLKDAFAVVVGVPYRRWMETRHLFWMDTRYYEHGCYSVIKDPIKEIWMKEDERRAN